MHEAIRDPNTPQNELEMLRHRVVELEVRHTIDVERERRLRQHAEELEDLYNNAPNGYHALDADGVFLHINDTELRWLGYQREEVIGKMKFADLLTDQSQQTFRAHFSRFQERGWVRDVEFELRCKNGTVLPVLLSATTVTDTTGHFRHNQSIVYNVTARRKVEDLLESLIATTQDGVVTIDRRARIVRFNPAAEKIFGYTATEVVGQKVNVLMAEPYAREHDSYIARYERTHEPHAIGQIRTFKGKRKNGEEFSIELSVTEVKTDQEVHYAALVRDISEAERLRDKAIENERLAVIGLTAAALAHEIGNPLHSMSLAAQMLERRLRKNPPPVDEAALESVRNLTMSITRLSQLLREFRNLSQRQDCRLRPTNLSQLVTDVLTAETDHYAAQGVTIVHDSVEDLPFINADADKLRQVLMNLCKNAVEAMPDGGTLTISAQRNGNTQVQLHITDTGSGIPEGINIFEPFVTTKREGTGLGLPVVRQIVAAHGGELTYRTARGQGSTFTVTLNTVEEETTSLMRTSTEWSRVL